MGGGDGLRFSPLVAARYVTDIARIGFENAFIEFGVQFDHLGREIAVELSDLLQEIGWRRAIFSAYVGGDSDDTRAHLLGKSLRNRGVCRR